MAFLASSGAGEVVSGVKYELVSGQVDVNVVGVAVSVGGAGITVTGTVVPVSKPKKVWSTRKVC